MIRPGTLVWKTLEFYGTRMHHRGQWRIHPWLRSRLNITFDGDLLVKRQGLNWLLNPSDFTHSHLYWIGEFETWELYHLRRLLRPGSTFLDAGANFGYFSLLLAAKLAGAGRVFAFEPAAATFARLQRNIELNQMQSVVTAIPAGLSDQPGNGFLSAEHGNSGAAHLGASGDPVTLDTIDRFCAANSVATVDLMKIDVEGSELRVLKGAEQTIASFHPPMMIEFNAEALQGSGASSCAELADHLRSRGYRLFTFRYRELLPLDRLPAAGEIINVFALPAKNRMGS